MKIYDSDKPYIFISYSHRDSAKVLEIMKRLKEQGFNCWYDDGIDPGTEWDENIAKHIIGCTYFISFISNNYIASHNCKDELNYARDLNKERLLVYLEDVELPHGMAMRMNRIQAIFWNKYTNEEDAYRKLFHAEGIDKTLIAKVPEAPAINTASQPSATPSPKETAPAASAPATPKSTPQASTNSSTVSKKQLKKWIPIAAASFVAVVGIIIACCFFLKKQSPVAQGIEYLYGNEKVAYDPVKALEIFEAEADKGNKDAAYLAAYTMLFELSYSSYQDNEKTLAYLELCKDENPYALDLIAKMYATANGVSRDKEKADALWQEARENTDDSVLKTEELIYHVQTATVLGYMYMEGSGREADEGLARSWLDYACDHGSVCALQIAGDLYSRSTSSADKNYPRALELLQKAIDKGRLQAYNTMGVIYYNGDSENGIEKDYDAAVKYFNMAIESGSAVAMYNLANCYKNGKGYQQNTKKALEWYEKAGDNGYAKGYYYLGKLYYDGSEDLDIDYSKAEEFLQKSLDCGGNGAFELGYIYDHGSDSLVRDSAKAISYYEISAQVGSSAAMYNLSILYYEGRDDQEKDYAKALDWMLKAAEAGYDSAYYYLGKYYYSGLTDYMDPNYLNAADYYLTYLKTDDDNLILMGNAYANLGVMLYRGDIDIFTEDGSIYIPETPNRELAYQYHELAAKQGNKLGILYMVYYNLYGVGTDKNLENAKIWLDKADAVTNYTDAQKNNLETYHFKYDTEFMTTQELVDKWRELHDAQDYTNARKYLDLAADRGDNDWAIYACGWYYCFGNQYEHDYEKGLKYLSKNNTTYFKSAETTGDFYAEPANTKYYNSDKAMEWYEKAISLGADEEKINAKIEKLQKNVASTQQ